MNDQPILKKPYNNISTPSGQISQADEDTTPKGVNVGKVSRAQVALQGLIGLK